MLFKLLKMFGLDVPAKFKAVKADVEYRVEQTLGRVQHVAQETAIISVLFLLGGLTGVVAIGIGFGMLYHWIADYYGVYAGLGAVAAIMVVATAIFVAIGLSRSSPLSSGSSTLRPLASIGGVAEARVPAREPRAVAIAPVPPAASTITSASSADLLEPLGYFLSKYVQYPKLGEPVLDELLGTFRIAAESSANDAVDRAQNVVRYGSRADLAGVLGGVAFVGWLLGRQAQHSITSHRSTASL
jgi:hypothetical protein